MQHCPLADLFQPLALLGGTVLPRDNPPNNFCPPCFCPHSLVASCCCFLHKPPDPAKDLAFVTASRRCKIREMSAQFASEHVCYVNCNYCNTILVVNVPNNCSYNMVTVKCGHCTMVLSMDLSPFHQARPVQDNQVENRGLQCNNFGSYEPVSRNLRTMSMYSMSSNQQQVPPIRLPEKRQRVPSAYNRFIKEEIQRIKTSNPQISHREAFSAAAKNWAHLPRLHFGLSVADGGGGSN